MQFNASAEEDQTVPAQYSNYPSPKRRFNIKSLLNNKGLLALILVLQLIIIILLLNPAALIQQFQNQQIVNEVSKLTTVNNAQAPVIALVSDADQLRGENEYQKQVYKDAQNGD